MARIVSSSITIGAGTTDSTTDPAFSPFDTSSATDRPAFIYTSTSASTTFVNHGTVTVTQAQATSGFLDGFVISPSSTVSAQNLFQNASDGRFGVTSNWLSSSGDLTLGRTIGFYAPQQMIAFRNDGIFVVAAASGEAYGVNVSGGGAAAAATITNGGTITVTSGYAAVGVYGATMLVSEFPATLPQIYCAIAYRETPGFFGLFAIRVIHEANDKEAVLAEIEVDVPEGEEPSPDMTGPFVMREGKFIVQISPFNIEGPGFLKVRAFRGDDEVRLGALKIEAIPTNEPSDESEDK